jgi:hypothetical protein
MRRNKFSEMQDIVQGAREVPTLKLSGKSKALNKGGFLLLPGPFRKVNYDPVFEEMIVAILSTKTSFHLDPMQNRNAARDCSQNSDAQPTANPEAALEGNSSFDINHGDGKTSDIREATWGQAARYAASAGTTRDERDAGNLRPWIECGHCEDLGANRKCFVTSARKST